MRKFKRRVIRQDVFETNSSAVHTLVYKGKPQKDIYMVNIDSETLSVQCGEYGWNGKPLYNFRSKLAYLMCLLLEIEYPDFDDLRWNCNFRVNYNILYNLDGYKRIIKAIQRHNKNFIRIILKLGSVDYPYGYVDHQIWEDYSTLKDWLEHRGITIDTFLFDDNLAVEIDNDNI